MKSCRKPCIGKGVTAKETLPYSGGSRGGGGVQGSGPPFGPRCRLFNIGPKVGPPLGPPLFFACRPKMDPSGGSRVCVCDSGDHPAPLGMWMTSHGQCPMGVLVNVQEWGCFTIFLRADDVTRTMSKGGCAFEKSCIRAWTPPPLSKILDPPLP